MKCPKCKYHWQPRVPRPQLRRARSGSHGTHFVHRPGRCSEPAMRKGGGRYGEAEGSLRQPRHPLRPESPMTAPAASRNAACAYRCQFTPPLASASIL